MSWLFAFLAQVVSLYSTLCLIRVFLSWAPQLLNTTFGRILSSICDPFLSLFKKIRLFPNSRLDFSPVWAFLVLSLAQTILSAFAYSNKVTIGYILSLVVGMIWSVINFGLGFLILVVVVRLVVNLINKDTFSSFWRNVDTLINPVIGFVSRMIPTKAAKTYRSELIISTVVLLLSYVLLRFAFFALMNLFIALPF